MHSKKVAELSANDFFITVATWDSGYGDSYEIGIRRKDNGAFKLIQSNKFNIKSSVEAAEAVVLLLNNGYSPSWIGEFFQ